MFGRLFAGAYIAASLSAVAFVVVGCAQTMTSPPVISARAAPEVVVKVVCPPLKTYSAEQQKALGAAVAALPADSPLVSAIVDYAALRAAVRACAAK